MKVAVYFEDSTYNRLKKYIKAEYGNRRVKSAIIQYAVTKFLDSEDKKSAKRREIIER